MKKALKSILTLLIIFILVKCNDSQGPTIYENEIQLNSVDSLDILLESDPLTQELINIRTNITERINRGLNINFTLEELRQAYRENNVERILLYMELSSQEAEELSERLIIVGDSLLLKYPDLNRYIDTLECHTCVVDSFFAHYNDFTDTSYFNKPLSCRWGPYIATLLMCKFAGPVFYWPCAYAAICAWCSGGIASEICHLYLKKDILIKSNHNLTWHDNKLVNSKIIRS
ncbi:MAG: hypothetical protein FJ213_12935 [Ignavibacteria bacterium]|nr:hypothetical protein [Ignavibacteria bacterium]